MAQAGLDSLGAAELRTALASRFSIRLPAAVAFDHPTPSALAAFIAPLLQPVQPAAAKTAVQRQIPGGMGGIRQGTGAVTQVVAASAHFPGAAPGEQCLYKHLHSAWSLYHRADRQMSVAYQHGAPAFSLVLVCSQCCGGSQDAVHDLDLFSLQGWTASGARWRPAPAWRAPCRCSVGTWTPSTAQRCAIARGVMSEPQSNGC